MEVTKDYFNLYVESQNTESTRDDINTTLAYTVLDKDEINQYVDLVKQKSWGEHAIGNHNLHVVPAHTIKIFDLSNLIHKGEVYNRDELLKMVPLYPETEVTLLEQLKRYGADVTKKMFGEELKRFLNRLQLEIQIEQRGINAETEVKGSFYSEGNMKSQVKSGSSVEAKLKVKGSPFFPKEFEEGILDSAVDPAFNVEKIATVFSKHLKHLENDESGQMVGIFGQWGRGKTYFTNKVLKILNSEKPTSFLTIKFQAWRYQQTPSIWAYLFETFIEEYLNTEWRKKACRHFRLAIVRNGWWKSLIWPALGIITGILAFSFASKLVDDSERQIIIKILGAVSTLTISFRLGKSIMEKIKKPATTIFNSFSKAPSFQSVLGVQAEIEKELKLLLKAWKKYLGNKRILLFVDDLDRCSEHQIIDIIDSLRVILDDEGINKQVLILVALDEEKLKKAIIQKYKSLFSESGNLDEVVSEYMDKLFISAIKLFPISLDDRSEFVQKLVSQINGKEITEAIQKQTSIPSLTLAPKKFDLQNDTSSEENSSYEQLTSSTITSERKQSTENLNDLEIKIINEKIVSITFKPLTPRQIRILIYRYLLARNLWLILYEELDWKIEDAINLIVSYSGLTNQDLGSKSIVNEEMSPIARMVVAY